jgi:hypothetical protein
MHDARTIALPVVCWVWPMHQTIVLGRFSLGVSGEYSRHSEAESVFLSPVGGVLSSGRQYRTGNLDLHGRWYPDRLSFAIARQAASVYVGEFIGYHARQIRNPINLGCTVCAFPLDTARASPAPTQSPVTQRLHGWEPGAELGVRVMSARHVVIDVGGALRLETIADPMSGVQPGGLVKRATVAVGVGW